MPEPSTRFVVRWLTHDCAARCAEFRWHDEALAEYRERIADPACLCVRVTEQVRTPAGWRDRATVGERPALVA
jgi:hypothetical protein